MITGQGSITETLGEASIQELLARGLDGVALDGKRVLVIIPDGTRTAPIPLLFRLLYEQIGRRVARLDYLIALGTHPPMSDEAIDQLVGVTAAERAARYPNVTRLQPSLERAGSAANHRHHLARRRPRDLTGGLLSAEVPVVLNRLIFDYDQLLICGPVFPHEVVGFSGGAKYFFPGIAGAEIVNFTHWLGALVTSMAH